MPAPLLLNQVGRTNPNKLECFELQPLGNQEPHREPYRHNLGNHHRFDGMLLCLRCHGLLELVA
jgi:hypothetical protein